MASLAFTHQMPVAPSPHHSVVTTLWNYGGGGGIVSSVLFGGLPFHSLGVSFDEEEFFVGGQSSFSFFYG